MANCMFCSDKAETHRPDAITGEMVDICWECNCVRAEWATFSRAYPYNRNATPPAPMTDEETAVEAARRG